MSMTGLYYLFVVLGVFACSCSQLLLKKAADTPHESFLQSLLNWKVIVAYGIMFLTLFVDITALHNGVNVKDIPILESLGYIFVPVLSMLVLKEKIDRRTIAAIGLIIIGIVIFYV